ncbi:hypothetical protein Nisw_04665 [Candidatus Nitrosopumilus sp. SW]|uniref:tetratricopeptide repeat protein n=1 Tax=Candidatus Nitrosopumilus sp. SW TaxID=2508726 RepID=UPI001154CB4A|nr:hypothetical protein [Candidatus Nitrosopumilus sp. SW]QDI88860.1 hypothetical protein Nisw_04665 [Candidatus Nitrosopumilus sp. SW]
MKNFKIIIIFLLTVSIVGIFDSFAVNIDFLEEKVVDNIKNQDYDKAVVDLRTILEIEPDNKFALNNITGVLIELDKFEESIEYADILLEIDPNNTKAMNNKAIASLELEDWIEAFRNFKKAIDTDPENKIAFENLKKLGEDIPWAIETDAYAIAKIYDKNDALIGYTTHNQITIQAPLGFWHLKEFGSINDVMYNGKNVQYITFIDSAVFDESQFLGVVNLDLIYPQGRIHILELVLANGFIVSEGDKVIYEIIIFDPKF